MIPLGEGHLRRLLKEWTTHYNSSRPHMSLGPGVPDPPVGIPVALQTSRHRNRGDLKDIARPVLGGFHHEFGVAAA